MLDPDLLIFIAFNLIFIASQLFWIRRVRELGEKLQLLRATSASDAPKHFANASESAPRFIKLERQQPGFLSRRRGSSR